MDAFGSVGSIGALDFGGEIPSPSIWDAWLGTTGFETAGGQPFDASQMFADSFFPTPRPSSEQAFFDQMALGANPGVFDMTTVNPNAAVDAAALFNADGTLKNIDSTQTHAVQDVVRGFLEQHAYVDPNGALTDAQGNPFTWDALQKTTGEFLTSPVGKIAATLGLGAAGILIGQAITGGGRGGGTINLPPFPVPPVQSAAQNSLQSLITGMPGATGVPGTALQDIYGPALTGQATLAQYFRDQAAREAATQTGLEPGAAAIRSGAQGAILPFMMGSTAVGGDGAALPPSLTTGLPPGVNPYTLATNQAIGLGTQLGTKAQDTLAAGIQPYTDPVLQRLRDQIQRTIGAAPTGPRPYNDPELQRLRAELEGVYGTAPTGPTPYTDPMLQPLRDQLAQALAGKTANPLLENQFKIEERTLRNSLQQQLGVGYELSTPGIQALAELRQRHDALRSQDNLSRISSLGAQEQGRAQFAATQPLTQYSTLLNAYLARLNTLLPDERARAQFAETDPIAKYATLVHANTSQLNTLLPQEQGRAQFAETNPLARYTTLLSAYLPQNLARTQYGQAVRQQGLAENVALAGYGRTPASTLATGLAGYVSPSSLLGTDAANAAARAQGELQTQAALQAFGLRNQANQTLASGIGNLFGRAASSVTNPTLSLRDLGLTVNPAVG